MRSPRVLNSSPASVAATPRVVRLSNRVPRSASSLAIRRLTIDLASPRLWAARPKLPASTTATKLLISSISDIKRSWISNRLVPNMGILVRQVNRYLSLIKSRFRRKHV